MKVGVVSFPGSNCDSDTIYALQQLGASVQHIDYRDDDLSGVSGVILPGGFSYGDYLRGGALAAKAPIMAAIKAEVQTRELPVLGICNGFQILTEAGLLPGVLRPNRHGQFRCDWQTLRVVESSPRFPGLAAGDVMRLPIAHGEGSYFVASGELATLFDHGEVWLQYVDEAGSLTGLANPNGALANIAGIMRGSVAALMPHPERAMEEYLGSSDGAQLLQAWLLPMREETN